MHACRGVGGDVEARRGKHCGRSVRPVRLTAGWGLRWGAGFTLSSRVVVVVVDVVVTRAKSPDGHVAFRGGGSVCFL